jgi:hypothetical protein
VAGDAATGELSLHRLIERFRLRVFPAASTPFMVFVQLYDGIGRYRVTMALNALDDDTSVAWAALPDVDFPDRLAKMEMIIPVDSVLLPRPGRYELIVLLDGQELARQHFDAETDDDAGQ